MKTFKLNLDVAATSDVTEEALIKVINHLIDMGRSEWHSGAIPGAMLSESQSDQWVNKLEISNATISTRETALKELRSDGSAVVVFSPDELGTATASSLEGRLTELGNEAITDLQDCIPMEQPRG